MNLLFTLLSTTQGILTVLAALFGIGFLIGIHELGHFLFCKIFNVSTPSFSIGFGPKIWSKKIGDTEFSLSAIPLGGYVEMAGNYEPGQGDQAEAAREDERSLSQKPLWQKLFIIGGGIIVNMAFAYLAMILLFACGTPATPLMFPTGTTTVKTVTSGSPAEKAGLKPGDTINDIEYPNPTKYAHVGCYAHPGMENDPKTVKCGIIHDNIPNLLVLLKTLSDAHETDITLHITTALGENKQLPVELGKQENQQTRLGVEFETSHPFAPQSFGRAIKSGIATTHRFFWGVFGAFKMMFTKKTTEGLGGPLMLITAAARGAYRGWKIFLLLLAFISANLAALNIIPLPILDGGQALIFTIESIFRRQLPEKVRTWIFIACWGAMLLLLALLTIRDISTLYSWFIAFIS